MKPMKILKVIVEIIIVIALLHLFHIDVEAYQIDYSTDYGNIIINAENQTQEEITKHLLAYDTEFDIYRQGKNDFDNLLVSYYQNPLTPTLTSYTITPHSNYVTYKLTYKENQKYLAKWQKYEYTKCKAIAESICAKYDTDKQKAIAINTWVCNAADYNKDAANLSATKDSYIQRQSEKVQSAWRPYGCVNYHYCVCSGYANTFKLICDLSGIECVNVTGSYNGGVHMWNKVKINNAWYNVDCTLNDDEVKNTYRLVSDKMMPKHKASTSAWCMSNTHNAYKSVKSYDYYMSRTFTLDGLNDYFRSLNGRKIKSTSFRVTDSKSLVADLPKLKLAIKNYVGYKSYSIKYNNGVYKIDFQI